ncbi:hypothetical protein J3A84_09675 [Proteiniclasticum sp. SCR006]|uniref:Uncharacterized protein n=1 Tax=Proteiniclasticum aestuarii TaxID=2817862 RepID=A0A939HC87_9CLOT|nr:hypothetical protein [Proteiniclasticum aestuarii]MBO1265297.1 hypothetical protein [Proteiniclasticum aestuarii]
MKKNRKLMMGMLMVILVTSVGISIFQSYKVSVYERELTDVVRKHLQSFAANAGQVEGKRIYAEQYANITAAQEAYIVLSEKSAYDEREWEESLPGLFLKLKQVMVNDEEKFREAFSDTGGRRLMFDISDDFEDHESIRKVYELLN